MDEVDFLDGPLRGVRSCFVLDGGADQVLLRLRKSSSDASEGEVGGEGAAVGVEAKGAAVFFHGRLKLGEGGQVAIQTNPEDAGVVGVGEDSEVAEGKVEGGMALGGRFEGAQDTGRHGQWNVAEKLEGQVDAGGVDPPDAGQAARFQSLGQGREGVLCLGRQVDGDEGADGVAHWSLRRSRSFLSWRNQQTRVSREYWALAGLGLGTTKTRDGPMVCCWSPSWGLSLRPSAYRR